MLDIALIERGLKKPGKTKGGLARAMGVRPGAVSEVLSGIRLIKASEIAPIRSSSVVSASARACCH